MREEIGAALSESGVFHHNPHQLQGRLLYYSGAIGTEPLMAEIILDQVRDFDAKHGVNDECRMTNDELKTALAAWLQAGRDSIGEIAISTTADGTFSLCHIADLDQDELQVHHAAHDALFIARNDASGAFRPLHSAPTLNRGWRLDLATLDELRLALDFFYPAAIGMAHALEQDKLASVPLREVLDRQTGMYRFANNITDEQAHAMIGKCCANTKCLRRILWPLSDSQPMTHEAESKTQPNHAPNAIPLLCIEACTHIVSAARKVARESFETVQPKSAD
jgi:sirohydrochlorin cobaltochelatase